MENLFRKLIEKGGVILPAYECSTKCINMAKENGSYYDDGNGNGCVHLSIAELNEYGGGIKNPKP